MSVKVMGWVWDQRIASGPKITLMALADHSDDDGVCWPGARKIAEKCGLNRATVFRHLKILEETGLLTRQNRRREDGSVASNIYIISCSWVSQNATGSHDAPIPSHDATPNEPSKEPSGESKPKDPPSLCNLSPPNATLPFEPGRLKLVKEQYEKLRDRFGDLIDVDIELEKYDGWLVNNPGRHTRDHYRGATNWLLISTKSKPPAPERPTFEVLDEERDFGDNWRAKQADVRSQNTEEGAKKGLDMVKQVLKGKSIEETQPS